MDKHQAKLIKALELDAEGDWDTAHQIVQKIEDPRAYLIHAYLHRKEGDLGNAGYWYSHAGQAMPGYDLGREWQELHDAIS
jgi:hypothetical protein